MRITPAALCAALLLATVCLPLASASRPLPAGVIADPDDPKACVWTDPGEDAGTITCADPTNEECVAYTVYETIAGPWYFCHVPAP